MRKVDPLLHERLQNLISTMGYELLGCELIPQGRQALFRIYIDSPRGITVDDCSEVSRQVSAMMDVEDPIQSRYTLEISSPGIDRPLFELEHYLKHIGQRVKIKLRLPINERRQYSGTLKCVENEVIYLVDDLGSEVKLPFEEIEKANLIGNTRF